MGSILLQDSTIQMGELFSFEQASYSFYLKSCLATFLTSTLLPSPIRTGLPFANSTASSTESAFTITYPPIVSLISPNGPLVTTPLC